MPKQIEHPPLKVGDIVRYAYKGEVEYSALGSCHPRYVTGTTSERTIIGNELDFHRWVSRNFRGEGIFTDRSPIRVYYVVWKKGHELPLVRGFKDYPDEQSVQFAERP